MLMQSELIRFELEQSFHFDQRRRPNVTMGVAQETYGID